MTDLPAQIMDALFGPTAMVPWWAWAAFVLMVCWGFLFPERRGNDEQVEQYEEAKRKLKKG